jgi:hypothetical protein
MDAAAKNYLLKHLNPEGIRQQSSTNKQAKKKAPSGALAFVCVKKKGCYQRPIWPTAFLDAVRMLPLSGTKSRLEA